MAYKNAMRISSILVITKKGDDKAAKTGRSIADWLQDRDIRALVRANDPSRPPDLSGFADGPDIVMVLGGDGTLIGVARQLPSEQRIPVLGVNMGTVGFLTDMDAKDWPQRLEDLLQNDLRVTERLCLEYQVWRNGGVALQGRALNDVVVSRASLARLIRLELQLDGLSLGRVHADGLIIATPTGSTAYSVSAGGPLAHPEVGMISVTSICPFLSSFPPLVLPPDSELTVGLSNPFADVHLTLDGQEGQPLEKGDTIVVRRSAQPALFVKTPWCQFAAKLLAKGFIRDERVGRSCV